eukprot:2006916-Rhodomonas_salina.1
MAAWPRAQCHRGEGHRDRDSDSENADSEGLSDLLSASLAAAGARTRDWPLRDSKPPFCT